MVKVTALWSCYGVRAAEPDGLDGRSVRLRK